MPLYLTIRLKWWYEEEQNFWVLVTMFTWLYLDIPEPTQSWNESVSWLAMDCDWRQRMKVEKMYRSFISVRKKQEVDGEIYHLIFLDFHFLHIVPKCAKSLLILYIPTIWNIIQVLPICFILNQFLDPSHHFNLLPTLSNFHYLNQGFYSIWFVQLQ